MTLSAETRNAVRDGCKRSAAATLPFIFATLTPGGTPDAMLDVGAGEGHWSAEALRLGVPAVHAIDMESHHRYGVTVYEHDARLVKLPLWEGKERWPLTLCLEMAEHLDAASCDFLVAELCRVSSEIVWSAAIPGQGGDGHVNEQWPAYWAERFNLHGFVLDDPGWRLDLWDDARVEPWYAQNLLYAYRPAPGWVAQPHPLALVHPVTWAHHRGVTPPDRS